MYLLGGSPYQCEETRVYWRLSLVILCFTLPPLSLALNSLALLSLALLSLDHLFLALLLEER